MSQVNFYTGVPERLAYLCRLLRKAQQSGARIGVCGPAGLLDRLDAALWTFDPLEFVPHLRLREGQAPAPALSETPILLVERGADLPHREVLLNLALEMPEGFEQFGRVLEVVSADPQQMEAGRQRFRRYRELGHEVSHHVVNG
ncbi:MAG: DNA polymerase III subunit chi [Burkholderiaceae bacterium]